MDFEKFTTFTPDDDAFIKFPSDNQLEIPTLDPAMQANETRLPCVAWGSIGRKNPHDGSYHFYTDDTRFYALWDKPSDLIASGVKMVIEPNFSILEQMPFAVAVFNTYKKRYLARFWQSRGIQVAVDLNVAARWAKLNLMGVPTGWTVFATRGYSNRLNMLSYEHDLACEHSGSNNVRFIVVGGGQLVEKLCAAKGWVHIPETMNAKKGRSNGKD